MHRRREARANRQTTNDAAGSWTHGHGSINSVGAKEDTDESENSPNPSSEEVNDSQFVNILLKKRTESRKYREGDLIAIKRALHGPELKFVAKRIIL